MLEKLTETLISSRSETLAKAFSRWGRTGFWVLVATGAFPLIVMAYTLLFSGQSPDTVRSGLPLIRFFSTAGFLLLVFLTLWFYRYTRIALRIQIPESRPSDSSLRKTVWTGVTVASLAILFSMLVLLFEVGALLLSLLSAPSTGVESAQPAGVPVANLVSAVDMMNLMSVILSLGGKICALIMGLLLLFRTIQAQTEP